jgi:hypothetical protein
MDNLNNFNKHGYCIVKSAISEELRDFVTQYALFDEQQDFDDRETGGSFAMQGIAHSVYADPAMETMMLHLQKIVQENTGFELYPTYSYYRVYRPGNILKSHVDRPSCEISVTLCFNYSYDSNIYQWPIFIEGKSVVLEPGDMAIYRGCDLEHWRSEFKNHAEDAWHVQGFFHYVNVNGPYKQYKFDNRPQIGVIREDLRKKTVNKSYITYTK